MTRRQSLAALAKSRGLDGATVWQEVAPTWDGLAWNAWGDDVISLRAMKRTVAVAALRAALGRYAAEAARLAVKLRALAGGSDAC